MGPGFHVYYGSEFKGVFNQTIRRMGLTHYWTYPKSPKMNAHIERFNYTIQEPFIDEHENWLFTDFDLFNRKLADWIVAYNTIIHRRRLGLFDLEPAMIVGHDEPHAHKPSGHQTFQKAAPVDLSF